MGFTFCCELRSKQVLLVLVQWLSCPRAASPGLSRVPGHDRETWTGSRLYPSLLSQKPISQKPSPPALPDFSCLCQI